MSFWRQLARERELRGVSLEEVADRTKISRVTLDLMESGDPAHLPARPYLLGYLKSYAEAVGLDEEDVLLRFEEQATSHDESEEGGKEEGEQGAGRGWPPRRVLLAVGVVLAAAGVAALVALTGS